MPRATNSVASRARRKKILKMAKGYYGARKNVWTVAKNAVEKGLLYAYSGRKQRKRQFRSLWIQRINAGARQHGMSYSEFMGKCSKKGIELNRKVLADLAMNHPDAFKSHILTKKGTKQKRNLTHSTTVDKTNEKSIKRQLCA
jgi:large subunit ribosomal protein L20